MLILLLLCLSQNIENEAEPLYATVITSSGLQLELYDFHINGPDPYAFALDGDEGTQFIQLVHVARISKRPSSHEYEVLLDTGQTLTGRISAISLEGSNPERPNEPFSISLRKVTRIHIVSGEQLKSCPHCGYEKRTPYAYCPVCGRLLEIGHFEADEEEPEPPPPTHRLRVTGRQ